VWTLRIAARMLSKTPGLTGSAIALLAVGIGGSTVLFSAFETVWLRRLPVSHPEQLVRMAQHTPQLGARSVFAYPYYRMLVEHSTTLSAAFGETEWTVALTQPLPAEQVRVRLVTPEFFRELDAHALYGRVLAPDDVDAVVVSYGFWRRRFHADPATVGRKITLHGNRFTIAGVMPREFNGISADNSPEIRAPLGALRQLSRTQEALVKDVGLDLAGRMKPGVTLAQAQAECVAMWRASLEHDPDAAIELKRGMVLDLMEHGLSVVRDKFGDTVRLLAGASGALLLLVCANVAGLLLAGAAARRGEIAVRMALGATRRRLVQQMMTESLLVVAVASAAGWMLAWLAAPLATWALPPIRDLATTPLEIALDFRPDARVMLAALAAAGLMAILVGMAPALSASRTNLDAVLRGARASQAWGGRATLVVIQIALCTLLVAGASLLVRTLAELRAVDPGFDAAHVATFTTDPGLAGYTPERARTLWRTLAARVGDLPGVETVAAAARPLMRGSGYKTTVARAGETPAASEFLNTSMNSISPGYFDAMGMRLVRGRALQAGDIEAQKPIPAVVNEAFVRRFYPDTEPLGQLFGNGYAGPVAPSRVIVGVVRDAKYRGLREPMTPTFYWASDGGFSVLCVRTKGSPVAAIEPVRRVLAALDPALPFTEVHVMSEEVETSIAAERLMAALGAWFGGFAVFLAAAGIYGLLAFAVEQRRREIGIRMALGARPGQIGALLGRQTALLTAVGVATGLGATLLTAGWIRTVLYEIAPADPVSLALAAAMMAAVAAAATLVPARRATRVQPASALRQ
jgi:predicted permease